MPAHADARIRTEETTLLRSRPAWTSELKERPLLRSRPAPALRSATDLCCDPGPHRPCDPPEPCLPLSLAGPVIPARSPNPIPSRTRPLNSPAPMVLCLKTRESRSSPDPPRTGHALFTTHPESPALRGAFLVSVLIAFLDQPSDARAFITRNAPASIVPRSLLRPWHASTRLFAHSWPPIERGITWSSVAR